MEILPEAPELRSALEEMTRQPTARHPTLLATLTAKIPNSIKIVPSDFILSCYTCLLYALGLVERPTYVAIATSGSQDVFAGADFAHWLLDGRYLQEIDKAAALVDDIVIYFDRTEFRHIGLWRGCDRLRSKWGVGQLYSHGLHEVPSSYGDRVRFFRQIPDEAAMAAFVEFARNRGVAV